MRYTVFLFNEGNIYTRMMNYGYGVGTGVGSGGMMGGFGVFASLISLIILIDLVLLGVWLWKHISKK